MTKLPLATIALAAAVVGGAMRILDPPTPEPPQVVTVDSGDVESVLTTNGRIEAAERYEVFAASAGQVVTVSVEVGDEVKRGAALALLDTAEDRDALVPAQARLDEAIAARSALEFPLPEAERLRIRSELETGRATLLALKGELERTKRLVAAGAAAPADAEGIEDQIKSASASTKLLRSQLAVTASDAERDRADARVREVQGIVDETQRRLDRAAIRAPISGGVYSVGVRPGSYVSPGTLVARIASQGRTEALIHVDEPELGRIGLGVRARLTADAYPDQTWECVVTRLPSEVVKLGSRRVGEIRCSIEGDSVRLIPNLTVDVQIVTARSADTLYLPREAVQSGQVWVEGPAGDPIERDVELGVLGIARVEILSGLEQGDEVIIPR